VPVALQGNKALMSEVSQRPAQGISTLIGLARPYRLQIGLSLVLGVLAALLEGLGLGLLAPILQGMATGGTLVSGNPALDLISRPFMSVGADDRMLVLMLALLALIIVKNGVVYAHAVVAAWIRANLIRSLRCRIFDQYLSVGYQYLAERRSGDLYNDLVNETNRAGQLIGGVIEQASISIVVLVCAGLLVAISWPLFLLVLAILGALSLVLSLVVRKSREAGEMTSRAYGGHASVTMEGLAAMRTIRLFCREDYERARFAGAVELANRADLRSALIKAATAPLSEIFAMVLFTVVLFLSAKVFLNQSDSILPLLLTFLFILYRLMPRVNQFNNNRAIIANNYPAAKAVVLALAPEGKPFLGSGSERLDQLREGLRFEDVSFRYGPATDYVLSGVNLEIPRGKCTAIVGASGAGKSTLIDLIPRFYDPTTGLITADGHDLRCLDVNQWRSCIGVVSQDTFVFNASVRDNVAYGRLDATDAEIEAAVRRANAFEFIAEMEKGLDTVIGDRGVRLSGGQRQRIAIARAVLRDPQILILDEATSALDTTSERLVQEALEDLGEDRTVVVVAHRLSTIIGADQIVVLDGGRIVEVGSHAVLLEKRRAYYDYYSRQFEQIGE
jgi:ATP-binding cassette, subfamily B, bacterial MsbA